MLFSSSSVKTLVYSLGEMNLILQVNLAYTAPEYVDFPIYLNKTVICSPSRGNIL